MNDSSSQQGAMPDEFDIGEYITNPQNDDDHQQQDFFHFRHQGPGASNMSLQDSAPNSMRQNVLDSRSDIDYIPQNHTHTADPRLEHQIKLQQFQLHDWQEQLELISNNSSMTSQQKEVNFLGLLTPGPSTEIRAIPNRDLVSPMILLPDMYRGSATAIVNQLSPHHNPTMSAPAALVFHTTPPFPLPSPAEPEYDLSPLTSPWLLPVSNTHQHEQPFDPPQRPIGIKRSVSSSGDEQGGARKRTARAAVLESKRNGPSTSPSSSSASARSIGMVPFFASSSDTPSPVSMPPPAPPFINTNVHPQSSSASSSASLSTPGSTSVSPNIAPVTPASIMKLGRLPTGLAPSVHVDAGSAPKKSAKGKGARRGSVARPGISPNLKPILPGGTSPLFFPLAPPPNHAHQPTAPLPTHSPLAASPHFAHSTTTTTTLPPRKTSHKAAEQKRRDSLKTSFDDLRLLLPPVPLPDDAADEPPLPGAMPPRGPPKGDADGPNRGVSKLALLRCGNAYIRDLQDKVGRRDREIGVLREEVRRLRVLVGGDEGGVDLERDVDEGVVVGCVPGGECGMDGDEEGE